MTVETGSAQNTTRPAAPAEAKHARGKSGADAHGAGGMGGFMAILASLDSVDVGSTTASLGGDDSGNLSAKARSLSALKALRQLGASGKADLAKVEDALSDLDPALAATTDIDKLLQGIERDCSAGLLPDVAQTDVKLPPDVAVDPAALLAQSAQWSATAVPGAESANPSLSGNSAAGGLAGVAGAAKQAHAPLTPESAAVLNAAGADAAMEPADKIGKAHKDASARLASAQAAMAEPEDASNAVNARQTQIAQKVAEIPQTPITTALAAAVTVASTRREESPRERANLRSNAADGPGASQTYLPSASGAAAPGAPDAPTPTDLFVAEKVAYWISSDVQNAEMKLDGIGDKPVEVSIRMQGNEAHIAFRSDELQARAALENASVHLKELLQREGLVLSGVSVGTAGAGDSGEQGRRPHQGVRPSGIASVQAARADRISGAGRGSGGALDLFV